MLLSALPSQPRPVMRHLYPGFGFGETFRGGFERFSGILFPCRGLSPYIFGFAPTFSACGVAAGGNHLHDKSPYMQDIMPTQEHHPCTNVTSVTLVFILSLQYDRLNPGAVLVTFRHRLRGLIIKKKRAFPHIGPLLGQGLSQEPKAPVPGKNPRKGPARENLGDVRGKSGSKNQQGERSGRDRW